MPTALPHDSLLPAQVHAPLRRDRAALSGPLVVFAGTAINLALGALYAWSMFKDPLTKGPYHLTNAQTALPYPSLAPPSQP